MTAPSDGAYFQIDYVFRHVTCEHDILITWFETKFSRNHVCFTICEHMILCIRCVGSKPVSQIKFSAQGPFLVDLLEARGSLTQGARQSFPAGVWSSAWDPSHGRRANWGSATLGAVIRCQPREQARVLFATAASVDFCPDQGLGRKGCLCGRSFFQS